MYRVLVTGAPASSVPTSFATPCDDTKIGPSPCWTSLPTPAGARTWRTSSATRGSPLCKATWPTWTLSTDWPARWTPRSNFAAETHVDRSLLDAGDFINTDVYGAYALMEAAKRRPLHRVVQVSTDEVYGSVESGHSLETDRLNPRNPYSASKAGGELMVQAYYESFKLPVIVTRGSNNFGPYHYPEKIIPLFITNAIDDLPLPMYGDGLQIRDWIYVLDHCSAIDLILEKGTPGGDL